MRKIYLNEFNIPLENTVYLPLVSGILSAYAKTFPRIKEEYTFMEVLYKRDHPDNIMRAYDDPFVAAFSVSLWNYSLSMEIIRRVKEKFQRCIIIMGGPNAPFSEKPLGVDYVINGEGEKKFVNILLELIGEPLIDIKQEQNLDIFPSPYASGEYDNLVNRGNFQAIVETNRGCPFLCVFCFWGMAGLNKRFRFHSLDFVKAEAEWCGKNKIKYVFCADSNFGMFTRDIEIAQIWVDVKKKYGYPEKFRVCYGKNAQESIYKTAKILSDAGLSKAITLAKQSNDEITLDNIRRTNISKEVYDNLQEKYLDAGIPTYVEIILGLPGETLESFMAGVKTSLKPRSRLFIYHCQILPNTEMANPEYIKKHGIKTVRIPLTAIHCKINEPGEIIEYENIVIATNTMNVLEWIEAAVYSWRIQLEHVFEVTEIPTEEIEKFYDIAYGILEGKSRGQIDQRFGNIYWEPEELAYLRISLEHGDIDGDLKQFAKERVLWGRKSRKVSSPKINNRI